MFVSPVRYACFDNSCIISGLQKSISVKKQFLSKFIRLKYPKKEAQKSFISTINKV